MFVKSQSVSSTCDVAVADQPNHLPPSKVPNCHEESWQQNSHPTTGPWNMGIRGPPNFSHVESWFWMVDGPNDSQWLGGDQRQSNQTWVASTLTYMVSKVIGLILDSPLMGKGERKVGFAPRSDSPATTINHQLSINDHPLNINCPSINHQFTIY